MQVPKQCFQSVTLPAVCKLGLVILEADAVREEGERNRRQEVVLIECAFHLSYWYICLCICIGKPYSAIIPLFFSRLFFPVMSEKLQVILSCPVVFLHLNEIPSLMEQPPSFLEVS